MARTTQKSLVFHESSFDYTSLLQNNGEKIRPYYVTDLGALYSGDCLDVLPIIKNEVVDTVFADPPFNLKKNYGESFSDNMLEEEYIKWCYSWINECIRILKPGGSFFIYNLPKWNIPIGAYLMQKGMTFRHWIAIAIGNTLPITGRLYPAHYSLLYYRAPLIIMFLKLSIDLTY